MFKIGNYRVCVMDLITDGRTGKLSSSKIGSIIGQAVLTQKMYQIANPTYEQMVAYGVIMSGTYLFRRFIEANKIKGNSNEVG